MMYSIVTRDNPLNRGEFKYYCKPEYGEEINIRYLANEISKSCTLTPMDVKAVIESLLQYIPEHLKMSQKVRLDDFGIFKLGFSSKGQEKEEDASASDIEGLKVYFTPCAQLRHELVDTEFSKVAGKTSGTAAASKTESEEDLIEDSAE